MRRGLFSSPSSANSGNNRSYRQQQQQQQQQQQTPQQSQDKRRSFAFMRYGTSRIRSKNSMRRAREHTRQIARQLSQQQDDENDDIGRTPWLGQDELQQEEEKLGQTDFFPTQQQQQKQPQHHHSSNEPSFAEWGEWSPQPQQPQSEASFSTTTTKKKKKPKNPMSLDAFVEQQQQQQWPPRAASVVSESRGRERYEQRTVVTAPPTFPSNSTMLARNHPTTLVSPSNAAARRRMRRRQQQEHERPPEQENYQTLVDTTTTTTSSGLKGLSGESSRSLGSSSAGRPPRRPQTSRVPNTPGAASTSNSTVSNSSPDVPAAGFSFDAFGLDAQQLDQEVNEALQDLGVDHPDLFWQQQQNDEEFPPQSFDTPPGSSRASSPGTPLHDDDDGFEHGFRIMGGGGLPLHVRQSPASSERSSLTNSTDRNNNNNTNQNNNNNRVNPFKEQAGFFRSRPSPNRRRQSPVTTPNQTTNDWAVFDQFPNNGSTNWKSPQQQQPQVLPKLPHLDDDDDAAGFGDNWASDSSSDLVGRSSSNGGAWSDVGVKSDVGRNSDIGVVPTEVVSPRKSAKKATTEEKKQEEESATPPVSALKKSWETKNTPTTPTRPRITTTNDSPQQQYLYRQESPVRELKQAWEQKVSGNRTPTTLPPQRPRARSPDMQESIERLGEQLGDEIMTPETITRKWPLKHPTPPKQQQQQVRAAECMEQRTSFASYRERLKPASSNNNNNNNSASRRSPTANHLQPTTTNNNKAPFVKLRKTGAMERFESTGTQEEEEEEEEEDAWKQADLEQEPVQTEPRKPTYRERRQQELQQQRQKEEEAQRAKNTSKPAERDVASLIRRRIAANKRSAAAAHQAATAAVAGDTEKTTDLSNLRSRLRKVSMESKITQFRSSVARPKPTVPEPKANPTPTSKQQEEEEEPTPNKTVAELMAERMASMSSSSSVKKEPSVPDKKSISASSDTTKTKLDAFFSHRLTDGPNLASLSKDEDDDKKNDDDDDHFAIAKSRKSKEKSLAEPAPKPAATTAAAPSAPLQPAPPVDSRAFDGRPALKDDPKYDRYFRMLKVGMPMEVVKHAMTRDGMDPSVMDGDHSKPAGFAAGVPLKNDPLYEKYFKMLKIGLPMGAVKNAMERDGMNPSVMDGDHNLPANSKGGKDGDKGTESKPKDKYRRTRLHWETVRKVRSDSLWAQIDEDKDVQDIDIDEQEFKELFQAEVLPAQSKAKNATGPTKRGAAVRVIDSKRANNGGIILARLKMTHDEMAEAVDKIDGENMSSEQMQNIIEYLPTAEERKLLEEYMLSGGTDAAEKFDGLCECEKFMVAMMTVKHAKRKVRALLFKLQFSSCIESLEQDAAMVESACDDLINSVRLRKLLGIVLNIGNRLNTAGSTSKSKAGAFTLESLLKLSQAKAFDRKTTFLHYIVLVVQRNNELLLRFKDDLPTVMKADKVYWDQVVSDLEEVENQLENVRRVALHQAQLAFRYSLRKKAKKPRENENDDDDSMSDTSMTLEEEVEALRATAIGLFTLGAIKQVSALRDKVENTKTKFSRLLEYFGEDERQEIQPHELFTIICTFCRDFDRAKEQVYDNVKKKKREERKKQANPPKAQDVVKKQQQQPRREPAPAPLRASSMQPNVSAVMKLDKQAAGKNGVHHFAATPPTKNAAAASSSSSSHPRRNGEHSRLQRVTRHRQQQQHSYSVASNQQRRVQQPEAGPAEAVSHERPPTEASTPSSSSQGMTMRQKARLRRNRMASSRYGNASVSPSTTSSPIESPTVVKATTPKKAQLEQSNVPLSPRSSIRHRRRMEQREQL